MTTAPAKIPVPPRLESRPRWHGLPIPAIALITPDGTPDFRVTDEAKRLDVIRERRCQLCGLHLGRNLFFVGGPASATALSYYEPPAHLDCLIYAMQVCPFICGQMQHAPMADVQADNPQIRVRADVTYTTVKSEFWVIIKAGGFETFATPGGTVLLRPRPVIYKTEPLHAASLDTWHWRQLRTILFNVQ